MTPQMEIAITGKNAVKPAFDSVVADANRVAVGIVAAGNQATASIGGAGFATANLAAQFNDIGVMLASGQSPLLLAIQQGTQISQVLGPMKAGAAVQALKGALVSLISPVSLITIGSIAAGAALVQWMTSAKGETEDATAALERHQKEIVEIVAGYGAAEGAVNAYFAAIAKRPQSIAISELNAAFEQIGSDVEAFRSQMASFADDPLFAKFGSEATLSMQQLAGEFSRGDITAEEFYHSLEDVRQELNLQEIVAAGIPGSTKAMIDAWQQGALKAIQFGDAINNLVAQSHALSGISVDPVLASFFEDNSIEATLQALERLTPELRTQQEIIEDTYAASLNNPALTEDARARLGLARDEALAAVATSEARREAARSSGQAAKEIDRERESVRELISQLEHEQSLIGMSNEQRAVANALRQAGAAATEEERRRIEDLVISTQAQEEAEKALTKGWEDYSRVARSSIDSVIDALDDGKISAEEFSGMLKNLGKSFLDMGLNGLFSSFGGGNILGSLFGGGGGGAWGVPGGFSGFSGIFGIPGMADGGTVASSGLSWVGEEGPELLKLPAGAQVIPNGQAMGMVGGPSITIHVDARGAERGAGPNIARELRRMLPDAIREFNANPLRRTT